MTAQDVKKQEFMKAFFWTALFSLFVAMPEVSFAQGAQAIEEVICRIIEELQGPVVRLVAAFAIVFLGFSLFLGKISWGVALAIGIGLGAVLAANEIVALLAGDGIDVCPGIT